MNDPYNLQRFVTEHERWYATALAEIRAGRKVNHWMWFIFPQLKGLGYSPQSEFYGISGLAEAQAYMKEPTLREHMLEICSAVLTHKEKRPGQIFESPDNMKFHSCMTLFAIAAPEEPVFREALKVFFNSRADRGTLRLLKMPDIEI